MDNKIPQEWNDILLKDVNFIDLMKHRIYNVMPLCWKTMAASTRRCITNTLN